MTDFQNDPRYIALTANRLGITPEQFAALSTEERTIRCNAPSIRVKFYPGLGFAPVIDAVANLA